MDSLVPLLDDAKQPDNLDNVLEQINKNLHKVYKGLERKHAVRVATRKRVNATKNRSSIGVTAKAGNLVLVEETGSTRNREGVWKQTSRREIYRPVDSETRSTIGLSVDVEVRGRKTRKCTVAISALSPFNDGCHVDGHHHRCG